MPCSVVVLRRVLGVAPAGAVQPDIRSRPQNKSGRRAFGALLGIEDQTAHAAAS